MDMNVVDMIVAVILFSAVVFWAMGLLLGAVGNTENWLTEAVVRFAGIDQIYFIGAMGTLAVVAVKFGLWATVGVILFATVLMIVQDFIIKPADPIVN